MDLTRREICQEVSGKIEKNVFHSQSFPKKHHSIKLRTGTLTVWKPKVNIKY